MILCGPEAAAFGYGAIAPTNGSSFCAPDFSSIFTDGLVGFKNPGLAGSVDSKARS